MKISLKKGFAEFGDDAQQMIIDQIQSIDLEKLGPKSICHLGQSLIALIRQSHRYVDETFGMEQQNWITIRNLSHESLVEILNRFNHLSLLDEIPEYDRSSMLKLLAEITKVCFEESRREGGSDLEMTSNRDELERILNL